MDEKGDVQMDRAVEFAFAQDETDDRAKITDRLNKCKDVKSTDPCDKVYNTNDCYFYSE